MIMAIQEGLSRTFPSEKRVFEANAIAAIKDIDHLSVTLKATIKPVKYLSFHDFTQYFDHVFGTECMGVIVEDPHHGSNVKHVADMMEKAKSVAFIVSEKQFNTAILDKFKDQGTPIQTLDYLGADLPADEHVYERIMIGLASGFSAAFSAQ